MPRGIPSQVLRHFQEIPLFSQVSKRGLRAIVQAATEVDVQAGKVLVREGQFGREMYVIVWGTATVTRDGKRVAELGLGDFFGELALLSGAPRSATVTAASDMRVMVLGDREMEVIIDREPSIARSLLAALASRVRGIEESLSH